mmetsp:Transcript_84987/g.162642  ORF Transcript_84987/g.162642 Transcript_84987/m.162642 type:complete len:114 (+) Transcript_84987:720-1061(+)
MTGSSAMQQAEGAHPRSFLAALPSEGWKSPHCCQVCPNCCFHDGGGHVARQVAKAKWQKAAPQRLVDAVVTEYAAISARILTPNSGLCAAVPLKLVKMSLVSADGTRRAYQVP